jgi:hypothetical protein
MTSLHDRLQDRPSKSRDYEQEAERTRRRVAENLDELSDRLTLGQAASMSGSIADTADRTRRRAADAFGQGRESAVSFIAEQPLLCAAIGIAVGSALASMLPSTDAEDKLMGERSDAVKGAAQRAGSVALESAVESAKNVASKIADRAQTAAKEEGLSMSGVAEAAHNLSEQIGKGAQGAVSQPVTGTAPQMGTAGPTDS